MTKLASELIRERIAKLEPNLNHRDGNVVTANLCTVSQLTWALELVEAQETAHLQEIADLQSYIESKLEAQEWTEFATRMPEPPSENDTRMLLVWLDETDSWSCTAYQRGRNERVWASSDGYDTRELISRGATHWRLVRGPGVGGGA